MFILFSQMKVCLNHKWDRTNAAWIQIPRVAYFKTKKTLKNKNKSDYMQLFSADATIYIFFNFMNKMLKQTSQIISLDWKALHRSVTNAI